MYKLLILCIFFTSCVDQQFPRSKKLGETEREHLYRTQEADLNIGEIKRETELSTIPSAFEVNQYLNLTLSPKKPNCREFEKQTTIQIKEDVELTPEEKLRKNFAHLGGDPTSLKQALCFMNTYGDKKFSKKSNKKFKGTTQIKNKEYMVIQDFNQPSSKKRLFLLNLKTGHVETFFSAHGMGKKNGVKNSALEAENFSNDPGTNLTARGFMVSGERVDGLSSGWKWHMKFDGLEKGLNDNNRDRLVVFHQGVSKDGTRKIVWPGRANSDQEDPELYQRSKYSSKPYKKWAQGMTWGCTSVSPDYAQEIYEKTKGGTLFYNYTKTEKESGEEYCGTSPLIKD